VADNIHRNGLRHPGVFQPGRGGSTEAVEPISALPTF
jgi:hypothetical protein